MVDVQYGPKCLPNTRPFSCVATICNDTIYNPCKNYGTYAVVSHNFKGIAPPLPQFNVGPTENWCLGLQDANIETGGGGGRNVSRNGTSEDWVHVKTRLSQCILSKICTCKFENCKAEIWKLHKWNVKVSSRLVLKNYFYCILELGLLIYQEIAL